MVRWIVAKRWHTWPVAPVVVVNGQLLLTSCLMGQLGSQGARMIDVGAR